MTDASLPEPRMLVVGMGGLGGTFAGWLHQLEGAGIRELVALTRNKDTIAAVAEHGFRLRGVGEVVDLPGRIVPELAPDDPGFDLILLATQPPQVEAMVQRLQQHLLPDGSFILIQNGLCEERVARQVGPGRVIGCIVGFGASHPEPGVFDRTSTGSLTLGRLDGSRDDRLLQVSRLLEVVAPVTLTTNLRGARWSKLAINCAISSLGTLGMDRMGPLMVLRVVRRLALEIMSEVVAVAHAEGVVLEKISGTVDLDWVALTDEERRRVGAPGLLAKHTLLLAVGTRYRRLRSSMLAAIEAGQEPAVDFLNGEVAARGQALGIPTPVNARVHALVHALARGEVEGGKPLLRSLAGEFGFRWGSAGGGDDAGAGSDTDR